MMLWIGQQPLDSSIVNLLFIFNVEVTGGQEFMEVLWRHAHEVLALHHFREMLTGKLIGHVHQVDAVVALGEGPDCQAVGGVEVQLHVLTAGLCHQFHLQDAGGIQQGLHVVHRQREPRGVRELHQVLDGIAVKVPDLDHLLLGLRHLRQKHGSEVRDHASQHQFVAGDQLGTNLKEERKKNKNPVFYWNVSFACEYRNSEAEIRILDSMCFVCVLSTQISPICPVLLALHPSILRNSKLQLGHESRAKPLTQGSNSTDALNLLVFKSLRSILRNIPDSPWRQEETARHLFLYVLRDFKGVKLERGIFRQLNLDFWTFTTVKELIFIEAN